MKKKPLKAKLYPIKGDPEIPEWVGKMMEHVEFGSTVIIFRTNGSMHVAIPKMEGTDEVPLNHPVALAAMVCALMNPNYEHILDQLKEAMDLDMKEKGGLGMQKKKVKKAPERLH